MQRELRLHRSDDFRRLREQGASIRHRGVILSYLPNGLDHNRYGLITSKRLGNAVVRNRTRRLLREALRLLHSRLEQGYDIVLIALPGLVGKPFHVVQRIVIESCKQARLLAE